MGAAAMNRRTDEIIESLENILDNFSSVNGEDQQVKSLRKTLTDMKVTAGKEYVARFVAIRNEESERKKVTSVAIHGNNQEFIEQLQAEAKAHHFTLSKENIINLALCCLRDKYSSMYSVEELVDCFY